MERPAETTNFRYPGRGHILRYARLAIDGSTDGLVEGAAEKHGHGDRHWVEFDHIPFIHNSLGAIQGGVVALSLERGGSWAAEAELGRPCRTTDLHLHYLALGRSGPFRARAEVLRVEHVEEIGELHGGGRYRAAFAPRLSPHVTSRNVTAYGSTSRVRLVGGSHGER